MKLLKIKLKFQNLQKYSLDNIFLIFNIEENIHFLFDR